MGYSAIKRERVADDNEEQGQKKTRPAPELRVVDAHAALHDPDVAVFVRQHLRAPTATITATPPVVGVLQYCAQFKDTMAWYRPMVAVVAEHAHLKVPDVPLMTREVLMTYMREPDPRAPWERPCMNLAREKEPHEGSVRCIAHTLSERRHGPGKGYRLRELLFDNVAVNINAAIESGDPRCDPRDHLSEIPNMCYMCYVWMTTELALNQKSRLAKAPSDDDDVKILNKFMARSVATCAQ